MSITLSQEEYATAWRLITTTSSHGRNLETVLVDRVLPKLGDGPTLLDVGAGSGTVAQRLARHFAALTLVEQNPAQIEAGRAALTASGARVFLGGFDEFDTDEKFDVVLCSHVLYHVPRERWSAFLDRLLGFVRPGGVCVVLLVGGPTDGRGAVLPCEPGRPAPAPPSTTHYTLRRDFTSDAVDTEMFVKELATRHEPYEVVSTVNRWTAATPDEMHAICRFVVYEDCFTAAELAALSEEELRLVDERIRGHARRCPRVDGRHQLEMEDGVVIISPRSGSRSQPDAE
ncbi:class I SAM-dependent methyltransferase [Streptomyces sp. NPDC047061]|uniref:class I SAM-dependent methyltransferase n=1 Tax=Streptomyces sp. NPDC047061 TaxID=3154605 RepID=UPI003405320B